MARSYSRDGSGRFSGVATKGGAAKTVQQDAREKARERKDAKKALSGRSLGKSRKRSVSHNASAGKTATTKRQRNVASRAKARFQ